MYPNIGLHLFPDIQPLKVDPLSLFGQLIRQLDTVLSGILWTRNVLLTSTFLLPANEVAGK